VGQIQIITSFFFFFFLLCFEAVLGLKINLVKSELILVGNVGDEEGLACILGCKVSSLPMKYLSLLLGAPFKARSIKDGFIEKIRVPVWPVGRGCTFIKSTLYNFLTYFLSLFPILTSITKCIEKLQ
jgi:hypothetical protein